MTLTFAPGAQAATSTPTPSPPPGDTTPPTTPTGLTVSTNCSLELTLRWNASTDDVGVVDYEIYRAMSGSTFAPFATATTTTYVGRLGGFSQYQVRARDAAGNVSAFTAPVTAYVPPCPPPTSTVPPTTRTPPPAGCSATYAIVATWPGGFQGAATVTNTGATSTTGWTVTLTFPNGQRITQLWGGRTTSTASPYVVTNETYNGVIAPAGSVTFGFIGTWTGANTAAVATCTRTP
ncbi:cellulose binding domain-containing protein [Luedemannella flava]